MGTADRMAVLDQGVVQQVGTPVELYDEPVNAFVAGFVGTMNRLPCRIGRRDGSTLTVDVDGIGELRLPARSGALPGGRPVLCLRPHALRVQPAGAAAADGADGRWAWLTGTVLASEFLGDFTRCRVRVGAHELSADQLHRAGQPLLAAGSAVRLGLDLEQARLLGD